MPPKKAAAPPLQGAVIALSGSFPGRTQPSLEKDFILPLGGILVKSLTTDVTHLVTNEADYAKPSAKVKQAKSRDIHIVNIDWLVDCFDQKKKLNESDYGFDSAATSSNGRKRTVSVAVSDDEDVKPVKKKAAPDASRSRSQSSTPFIQSALAIGSSETNIAPSKELQIPADEHFPQANYRVYIGPDGVIYDAALNQTNAGKNNNKFYRVQVLHNGGGNYQTWTRWGRVGERGQSAALGGGSLGDALKNFDNKFKTKTGLAWADRAAKAKSGKYTYIERSYAEDSEDDDTPAVKDESKDEVKLDAPDSKLDPAIQDLMELIFNQQYFAATMTELNYDVNKLPLGKLSKNTIARGYQALKDLSAVLDDANLAQSEYGMSFQSACEELSNAFYSLIPHAFGRNRPPVIGSHDMLKREVDLLDSLSDMKDASNIMKKDSSKDAEKLNVLDQQFKGLNLNEMTPLKKNTQEFTELKQYLVETKGHTHNASYSIDQIFRIERKGESARFEKSFLGPPQDRRLLWHGSRCTNFGGILSQGLRIAPPEAPVSGYMFGKGIYLADMSSKSANYCCPYISGGTALLLLCEAELGKPMQTLTDASYSAGEDAKQKGLLSTWGQGQTGPSLWKDGEIVHPSLKGTKLPDTNVKPGDTNVPGAYLQYNEYIAYDISQVRLRYLFRVRM